MRYIFTILSLFVCGSLFAQQPDYGSLPHAVADFDKSLETKDTVALKWLLSDKLQYGHSNGWIEKKEDVIKDLFNGKLTYKKIKATDQNVTTDGDVAAVRNTVDIDVLFNGKPMNFKLKVLQIWLWENKHWVLFARQSVSVGEEK